MPFWTFSHAYVEKVATCVSASSTNRRLNRPKRKELSRIIPPSPFQINARHIFESLHQSWIGEWPTHATYLHKFHILVQDPRTHHNGCTFTQLLFILWVTHKLMLPNCTGFEFFFFFFFLTRLVSTYTRSNLAPTRPELWTFVNTRPTKSLA